MTRSRDVANIIKQPFTTTLGTSNYRAGVNAGNSIESGGNYNVCVGDEAGTAISTGDDNTVVGYVAGDAINTGGSNVAVGFGAMSNQTGASANVAVGRDALFTNVSGLRATALGHSTLVYATSNDNTAVGFQAGLNLSTAVRSTIVGSQAGAGAAITGAGNTLFGYNAGNALTTGHSNTLGGQYAGDALTTGNYNTAWGDLALSTETTGAASTAIGEGALQRQIIGNTNDSDNLAAGYVAGAQITTGVGNVLLGRAGSALTDADNNVAIGRSTLSLDTLGSRTVAIGSFALQNQNFTTAETVENTVVGYHAGQAVTTGFKNTIVGALGYDNLQNGDRNISIGYDTTSSGVNDSLAILIGVSITSGGAGTARLGNSGGTATLSIDGSDTSWAAASDSRLKKDVENSTVGLEFIKDLRPVTFKWNAKDAIANTLPQYDADSSDPIYGTGKAHHGFIAQEVKAVIDSHSDVVNGHNLWSEDPDGTQQVSPSALVPMLVKAIQEQNALIVALTARVATLEG